MFNNLQLFAHNARLRHIWRAATLRPKFSREELSELNISEICEEILNPHNFAVLPLRLKATLLGGLAIVHKQKVKLFYSDLLSSLKAVNAALPSRRSERIRARANPVITECVAEQPPHLPDDSSSGRTLNIQPPEPSPSPTEGNIFSNSLENLNDPIAAAGDIGQDTIADDVGDDVGLAQEADDIGQDTVADDVGNDVGLAQEAGDIGQDTVADDVSNDVGLAQEADDVGQDTVADDVCNDVGLAQVGQDTVADDVGNDVGLAQEADEIGQDTVADDVGQDTVADDVGNDVGLAQEADEIGQDTVADDVGNDVGLAQEADDIGLPLVLHDSCMDTQPQDHTTVEVPLPPQRRERIRARANPVIAEVPLPPRRSARIGDRPAIPKCWFSSTKRRKKKNWVARLKEQHPPVLHGSSSGRTLSIQFPESSSSPFEGNSLENVNEPIAAADVIGQDTVADDNGNDVGPSPVPHDLCIYTQPEDHTTVEQPEVPLPPQRSEGPTFVSTQTQSQSVEQHFDDYSLNRFREDMKNLVDAPNSPSVRKLSELTNNISRKEASMFFYLTCALATEGFIKVEQEEPYGEVLITRGSKTV